MPIAAVLFDFDGVIADTERLHLSAFQEAFAEPGWTLGEPEYFERYIGFDDRGLIVAYADDRRIELSDADIEHLMETKARAFSRHLTSTNVLFPGSAAAIQRLADRYVVGIASGALHHEIAAILETAGLLSLFPVIVAADDVTASKPSPEPYLTAAAKLGVAPAACVAIEDSVAGLQSARAAGMRTIAVTTSAPRQALASADRIVSGLHDVSPDLIDALGTATAL